MTNINPEALYNACVAGDAALVGRLLPAGGTPRNLSGQHFQCRVQSFKFTPLMEAAARGHTQIVRMILQRARNTTVDHVSAIGFTALSMAAQYHHAGVLRVLADHGANVHFATGRGDTALGLAVRKVPLDGRPRDPDPDGTRTFTTVRALHQLGAGTSRPPPLRAF